MSWAPFLALPNYLGGKRRLAPVIFREIARIYPERQWPGLTLLDPCAGACSISLYAKAQGMRVIAGDIAERSLIVQQAVIANDAEHLDDHDLGLLFEKRNGCDRFVATHFVPAHFPSEFADFLDLALANIADHPSPTRQALLRLVLFKMMKAPRIQFSDTTISRAVERDTIEHLAGHKARMADRWYLTPPAIIVKRLARVINNAIFANGHQNLAHLCDAQDLVEEYADQVDILYLDPPYPGVTGYETYHVLDCVFAGRLLHTKRSLWSTPQFTLQLLNLLEAADPIPLWVLSYGSVGVTLRQILDLVELYRPARAITVAYPHLQAIARPEVADANREYIIVARKEPE
jgi:hypothetical protein